MKRLCLHCQEEPRLTRSRFCSAECRSSYKRIQRHQPGDIVRSGPARKWAADALWSRGFRVAWLDWRAAQNIRTWEHLPLAPRWSFLAQGEDGAMWEVYACWTRIKDDVLQAAELLDNLGEEVYGGIVVLVADKEHVGAYCRSGTDWHALDDPPMPNNPALEQEQSPQEGPAPTPAPHPSTLRTPEEEAAAEAELDRFLATMPTAAEVHARNARGPVTEL